MSAGEQEPEDLQARLTALLRDYQAAYGDAGGARMRGDLVKILMAGPLPAARPQDQEGAEAATKPPAPPPARRSAADIFARFPAIRGASPSLRKVLELVEKVAPTDATVLIHGESGTGKELIARAIHDKSPRSGKPYVAENCAALPESLLESELFGHSKGAFTGADRSRKGRFAMADGGTLFLDEVGDMSPGLQKKLLRALQEGEIRPVGSSSTFKVDVRFLSASNKDLRALVEQGLFREDLYYRLSPIRIDLPPLRERGDDVLLLARWMAEEVARKQGQETPVFTEEALAALRAYPWPGNVRQLQNELLRVVALAEPGQPIDVSQLSPEIRSHQAGQGR